MNSDQTAPSWESDLGPYCLQYKITKNIRADDKSGGVKLS